MTAASPYKFLDFYERDDASDFAGRDQEIDDIVAGIARSRCFVLYGRSGLGKTSLLHAGVIPRLEQRGFEIRYLRILADPVGELCTAIAAQVGRDAVEADELPAVLAARPRPFVLVLDQFEEFLIRSRSELEQRARFAALIGKILDDGAGWVRLVVSLREDYYAELEDLEPAIRELTGQRHRLVSLSAYGVRQAVVRPLIRAGIPYEERFVDQIVDELAAFDFDPLLLQLVCGEVYDDAVRDARDRGGAAIELRASHIERGGGIRGALARYVARVSAALAGDDRLLACAVLDALTTAENTKRALLFADLLAARAIEGEAETEPEARTEAEPRAPSGAGFYLRATPEELRRVLDRLCRARLVRMVHRERPPGGGASAGENDEWYELLHDRLVPVVKDWLDAEPAFDRFRFAKQIIASLSSGRSWRDNPGGLLSATQLLQQVVPHAQRLQLAPVEAEFVLRSAIYDHRPMVPTLAAIYDEAFGPGSSAELMTKLVAHPDLTMRRAAARAAVNVEDPKRRLPALCARLALEDPIEEVRRAAGRSLAALADNTEIAVVNDALGRPRTRQRAVEVVTDLLQFGGPTAAFPLAPRLAAAWYRKARVYREHKERIRDRASDGAIHGFAAATAFIPVASVSIAMLVALLNPIVVTDAWPKAWLLETAAAATPPLLVAVLLGGLLGWRSSLRMVRNEALGAPPTVWTDSAVRGHTSTLLTYALTFGVIGLGELAGLLDGDLHEAIVFAVVLTVIWWVGGPIGVRWVHRTIEPGCPTARAALWSSIAGSGLALAAALVVALMSSAIGREADKQFVLAILLFQILGFNLTVASLVRHGATKVSAATNLRTTLGTQRNARRLALSLLIGIPILAMVISDPGKVPLRSARVSLENGSRATFTGTTASHQPVYFRVQDLAHDSVLTLEEASPGHLVVEGSQVARSYVMRTGESLLGAVFATSEYSLNVRAKRIYEIGEAPAATSDSWTFAWVYVYQIPSGINHYFGTFKIKIAVPSPIASEIAIRVVLPASDYLCTDTEKFHCMQRHSLVDSDDLYSDSFTALPLLRPGGDVAMTLELSSSARTRPIWQRLLIGYRTN